MSEFNHDDPDQPDNKVGYKKPPKKHQYKPGQSGNPKGRPPGKLLYNVVQDLMSKVVKLKGSATEMSYIEAVLMRLLNEAVNGDYGATKNLISLILNPEKLGQLIVHAPYSYDPEDLDQDENEEEDW